MIKVLTTESGDECALMTVGELNVGDTVLYSHCDSWMKVKEISWRRKNKNDPKDYYILFEGGQTMEGFLDDVTIWVLI